MTRKIILSRKGFDSGYGGFPSLVIDKQDILTLPIPARPQDPNETEPYKYSEIQFKSSNLYEILKEVRSKNTKGTGPNKYDLRYPKHCRCPITQNTKCHFDPDLDPASMTRTQEWRGNLGQCDAAQGHLENQDIRAGDLFIFFGWFQHCESDYTIKNEPSFQMIFGYLEIEHIYKTTGISSIPVWLNDHPHIKNKNLTKIANNTIYVGSATSSWNANIPGSGILKFSEDLILTAQDQTPSRWKPEPFQTFNISYHTEKSRQPDYFQSARIGQEFVIPKCELDCRHDIGCTARTRPESEFAFEWATKLIDGHQTGGPT